MNGTNDDAVRDVLERELVAHYRQIGTAARPGFEGRLATALDSATDRPRVWRLFRSRWLMAPIGAIAVLAIVFVGVGLPLVRPAPAGRPSPTVDTAVLRSGVTQIGKIARGGVWAIHGNDLVWSFDTVHWQRAQLPLAAAPLAATPLSVFMLDADHAWLAYSTDTTRTPIGPSGVITIARTVDGGASWTESHVPGGGQVARYLGIGFADAQTGYVVANPGLAGFDAGAFRTSDGGATWSRVVANTGRSGIGSRITVVDRATIWAAGDPTGDRTVSGALLAVSRDGGTTWTEVPEPTLQGTGGQVLFVDPPVFLDAQDGFVAVHQEIAGGGPNASIRPTSDGGQTWDAAPGQPVATAADFTDRFHWYVAEASHPRVGYTDDRGMSWSMSDGSALGLSGTILNLAYVDPKHGVVMVRLAGHSSPLLYATANGFDWLLVDLPSR